VANAFRTGGAVEGRTILNRKFLIAAVVVASGVAAYVCMPRGAGDSESESADRVTVAVANRYIPAFTVIKKDWVDLKPYPKEYVPPAALHSRNDFVQGDGRELFMSNLEIPDGQPLTRIVLADTAKSHGLSTILHPGKMAVSFATDRARGAGGWIQPGDTVALFETAPRPGSRTLRLGQADVLFSAVEVLAVDNDRLGQPAVDPAKSDALQLAEAQEKDVQVVTVLLNTSQVSTLIEARERGAISVGLRAPGDDLEWPATN